MRLRKIWPTALLTFCLLAFCLLALGGPTLAQDEEWAPPEPSPESMDWLLLNSGEWLRGEIHLLRDDDLDFESDELDDLALDWGDVAEIRSPRILTYTFDERGVATGTAVMRDDVIVIQTEQQVLEFPRSDLLTIIEGHPSELNYWSARVGVSMIVRSGNTDPEDYSAIVNLRRQATRTRLDLDYKGNFAKTNDEKTANNHRGTARFDYQISRGFFITPFTGELYSDEFQNIDLRASAGAGVGYFLVRKSGLEWSVQLAGGYVNTRFVSVQPGESIDDGSAAILPATLLEVDITNDIELDFSYDAQVTVPDTDGTVHHLFAMLSFELTSILDFDTSITWDRVENPKADADGNVPKPDDLRFYFGLSLDI